MSDWPKLDGIPVVVTPYLPPGKVYLVSCELPIRLPIPKLTCEEPEVFRADSFRYLLPRTPDPPKFLGLDTILKEADAIDRRWKRRERKQVSRKQREKAQRRLDYASNARRRKRRRELARRQKP